MTIDLIDNAERAVVGNSISWTRLVDQLRAAGEIQPDEAIARFIVTPRGIEYRVVERTKL